MDDASLDKLIEMMVRERDPEYKLAKLLEIDPVMLPVNLDPENIEGLTLVEYLKKLRQVSEEVGKHLALARRFCCKSRPKWEKCNSDLEGIHHRLLAHPCVLWTLSQKYSLLRSRIETGYYDFRKESS